MDVEYEIIKFEDGDGFRVWLDQHHDDINGVWLRLYKKASGVASLSYPEALDVALCYGWIDGQRKKGDELSFLQKFTPRRPKSLWSKRNIEYIKRLTAAGLMMPAGFAEVHKAQQDGRWGAAYDKPTDMVMSDEFLTELHKYPRAEKFFQTLNKTTVYAIAWRLQTARTEETKLRRQA